MTALNEVFLFSMACDPPAYLWSGVGDLLIGGQVYKGGGELLADIPELQQLVNGIADSVTFTANGVDAEAVRLANEDRDSVDGAAVRIGTVLLDQDFQPSAAIEWEWEGIASVVTIDRQGTESGNAVRSISLIVTSGDVARSRSQLNFWTDAEQRREYPTDAFFSNVAGIAAGNTRRFGK